MKTKPNILFIMCDQLRADALGCTGHWVKTPNIDRIALEGVRFSNCVTNSPVCLPARVSLATGRYPHNTQVWDNCPFELPEGTPTWMAAIRNAGYRTSLFGKAALHRRGPDIRNFEHVLNSYGLDDVDEIRGPRASVDTICHMTARWDSLGLLDAFRKDIKERAGKNKTLGAVVLLGQFCRAARTVGYTGALREHVSPGRHAGADQATSSSRSRPEG